MKIFFAILFSVFTATFCFAQDSKLLLDNFEIAVSGGPEGTVDFGAGNGSSVEVTSAADSRNQEKLCLKISYDAVSGGYIWVARGFGLTAKNAGWMIKPKDIDWKKYNAFSFYLYGSDSKTRIAFDIKDSGNEMWRFLLEDNFKGWKEIICPFDQFFCRGDWQPEGADKNAALDFPVQSYQFEPLPEAKGAIYVDDVSLVKK